MKLIEKNIYLDHAATTPLSVSTKEYIISLLDVFGNPSSLHSRGKEAKELITKAYSSVAKFINSNPENIILTSSGSASNTLAIMGYVALHYCTVLFSPTAHKSILKCIEAVDQKYALKVNNEGTIDLSDLENWLKTLQDKAFVVLEYANSEIGTIQEVKKIVEMVHKYNGVVFLDCTGSISTIPLNTKELNIDLAAFSAHKIGGLKGVGVLYKKKNIDLKPLVYGSQNQGLFSGTENVIGIAALGNVVDKYDYNAITSISRDYVYDYIKKNIPDSYLIGASIESGNRLSHNLYVCFRGIMGESLMILLNMNDIQISTGSACSSGSLAASDTLTAIGVDENDIHSCIRMSFSGNETIEELGYVCGTLKQCVKQLRNFAAT